MIDTRKLITLASFILCTALAHAQSYDTLVQKGDAQLQAGSAAQALTLAQQAIKLDASRWQAYALAGGALMNLKRYEDAEDKLSKAIELAPAPKQAALRNLRKQCALAEGGASPAPTGTNAPPTEDKDAGASVSKAETVLWLTIQNSTNPDDFNTYLSTYPHGAYVALAQRHLDSFSWNAIANSTNASDFQTFLSQHPGSAFAPQAQARLDQIDAQTKQIYVDAAKMKADIAATNALDNQTELKRGMFWIDPSTSLMWQRRAWKAFDPRRLPMPVLQHDDNLDATKDAAGGYAQSVCEELNKTGWAGYKSGWRLPTIDELQAVFDKQTVTHTKGDLIPAWAIKTGINGIYWSSSASSSDANKKMTFNFGNGKTYAEKSDNSFDVLCVRPANP